jgi:hypothetical protein
MQETTHQGIHLRARALIVQMAELEVQTVKRPVDFGHEGFPGVSAIGMRNIQVWIGGCGRVLGDGFILILRWVTFYSGN